jgi:preprotein translocase subunit SecD
MKTAVFSLLAVPALATAANEPDFHLCAPYVEQSVAGEQAERGGWPVFVKLTERGSERFALFTEANVGKPARIVVDGRTFARATIRAPIRGGSLRGEFATREEAGVWLEMLEGGLPLDPCGID